MTDRTPYQDKIIRSYYQNQSSIMEQKLGEMVADLYLAEGKGKVRLWKRVEAALKNLKIAPERIDHLMKKEDPALIAQLVSELMNKKS